MSLALVAVGPAAGGAAAPDGPPGIVWRQAPFVIGAAGRLDGAGDRRHPRRRFRPDSTLAAYADVEEVDDATWLQHEVERYARRAFDCGAAAPAWCRRQVRRIAGHPLIVLVAGVHAEIVWIARNTAVRLGWTRIVTVPSGSMTIEAPPAEFAIALLDEFPSQLAPFDFNAHEAVWAANERDRLLYYVDQVVRGLADIEIEAHRRHAVRFIEDNLAQISALAPNEFDQPAVRVHGAVIDQEVALGNDGLPLAMAEQLAVLRRRQGASDLPWCAAAPSLVR